MLSLALKMEGTICAKECSWPLEAERSPWVTGSKETETSVLQLQEPNSATS